MTPMEIARLYVEVVTMHDSIPDGESGAKDAVGSFRSNIHQSVMDTFRAQGVQFETRSEAAQIAFEMAAAEVFGEAVEPRDLEFAELHTRLNLAKGKVAEINGAAKALWEVAGDDFTIAQAKFIGQKTCDLQDFLSTPGAPLEPTRPTVAEVLAKVEEMVAEADSAGSVALSDYVQGVYYTRRDVLIELKKFIEGGKS